MSKLEKSITCLTPPMWSQGTLGRGLTLHSSMPRISQIVAQKEVLRVEIENIIAEIEG